MPKKKSKKSIYLLDTSIQIRKLFDESIKQQLKEFKLKDGRELASSYFVLYEFKVGFIAALMKYYLFIKTSNKFPQSIGLWSNTFSSRDLKYKTILESLMLNLGSIPDKKQLYLERIESVIFLIISNFSTDIKGLVGDFSNDELVNYEILSWKDYNNFLEIYNSRNKIISQISFWTANNAQLKKLLLESSDYNTKPLEKIYKVLVEINEDLIKADKQTNNRALGDAVIAVDCPKSYTVVALDHSFAVLCAKIQKKSIKIAGS